MQPFVKYIYLLIHAMGRNEFVATSLAMKNSEIIAENHWFSH